MSFEDCSPSLPGEVKKLFASSSCPLDDDQSQRLALYLGVLGKWSRQINLTGFKSALSAAEGLLYDAAEIAPLVPRDAHVLDVGAGAGGLSFALALLRSDLAFTLVEPRTKRAVFIRTARRELSLDRDRFRVIEARAEELPPEEKADIAYAQAVMSPELWLPLGASLVRDEGLVLCLTSKPLEIAQIPSMLIAIDHRNYRLPQTSLPRSLTLFRRSSASVISR